MDESISVSLRTISGQLRLLSPKRSMTVRELLTIAHISCPANAFPLCLYRGSRLQLDLSLAHQHIEDLSTIVVAFHRRGFSMRAPTPTDPGILQEAFRVSDIFFLELESSRNGALVYKEMRAEREQSGSDDDDDPEEVIVLTVIEESKQGRQIAETPLPTCWEPHAGWGIT
jgi:hypothetical protein